MGAPNPLPYLRLFHHDGFGSRLLSTLLARMGSLENALGASPESLLRLGLNESQLALLARASQGPVEKAVQADLDWLCGDANHLITYDHPEYPALLKEISSPPPLLYVRGYPDRLSRPHIAVVGSRNATSGGRHHGYWLARALARAGLGICSGLARGIDTAAHRGALAESAPTVAILGTGVDMIYPPANRDLAEAIVADGALVSEFPLGSPPLAAHFPQRNRIISGISLGVLVVEAARDSGSLITARFALEQNREVFALPGAIGNPLAKGCHELIRQGAKLVDSPQGILEEFTTYLCREPDGSGVPDASPEIDSKTLSRAGKQVLQALGFEARGLDALFQETGLGMSELSGSLVELEMHGLVEQSGGRYRRLA